MGKVTQKERQHQSLSQRWNVWDISPGERNRQSSIGAVTAHYQAFVAGAAAATVGTRYAFLEHQLSLCNAIVLVHLAESKALILHRRTSEATMNEWTTLEKKQWLHTELNSSMLLYALGRDNCSHVARHWDGTLTAAKMSWQKIRSKGKLRWMLGDRDEHLKCYWFW